MRDHFNSLDEIKVWPRPLNSFLVTVKKLLGAGP
jgi:hypothetical protein